MVEMIEMDTGKVQEQNSATLLRGLGGAPEQNRDICCGNLEEVQEQNRDTLLGGFGRA